jgi:hypothetical protein
MTNSLNWSFWVRNQRPLACSAPSGMQWIPMASADVNCSQRPPLGHKTVSMTITLLHPLLSSDGEPHGRMTDK